MGHFNRMAWAARWDSGPRFHQGFFEGEPDRGLKSDDPALPCSDRPEFAAPDAGNEVVPLGVGQRYGIPVFADTYAIVVNLDRGALTAFGAKRDLYLLHLTSPPFTAEVIDLEPWLKLKPMLTIGKVGRRTGLSTSAIRYYERYGLLRPSRLPNGYRLFDEDTIKVLRFLRRAQTMGITLKEINQLLELTRDGQRPCGGVRELARRHLTEIDVKIRQLRSLRKELQNLLARRVAARSNELCPLISSNPK